MATDVGNALIEVNLDFKGLAEAYVELGLKFAKATAALNEALELLGEHDD